LAIERAALNVLELEVQMCAILEGAVDAHQEGTLLHGEHGVCVGLAIIA